MQFSSFKNSRHPAGYMLLRIFAMCLLLLAENAGAQSYSAAGKKNIVLSFSGIRITHITEYTELGLTRYRILKEAKQAFDDSGGKITLESLQNVASRITVLYRQAGFVFTRAYVPQQKSKYGAVEVRLLEGHLESVDIYDNKHFDKQLIRSAFEPLVGKVITSADVEQAMALTNDIPGLDVFGFYSIGEQRGGTRLNIRVRDEKSCSGALRLDNHGSKLTGNDRALLEWEQYNLFGTGDSIRLGALQTFNPGNASYGFLDFQSVLGNPRYTGGFSVSSYNYALGRGSSGVGQLDLVGDTQSLSLNFSRKLKRSLADSRTLSVTLNQDSSESRSKAFTDLLDIRTRSVDVGVDYGLDFLDRKARSWRSVSVELKAGVYQEGTPRGQGEQFYILRLKNTEGHAFMPFWGNRYHQLKLGFRGQYSDEILPPAEQFSLAGAEALRGFDTGVFSADTGVLLDAEWMFPVTRVWQSITLLPSIFVEYGYGVQRLSNTGGSDDWAALADAGVGLSMDLGDDLNFGFSMAKPLTSQISYSNEETTGTRFYAKMVWRFF